MKTVAMIGWIQNLERKSKPVLLLTGAVFLAMVGAVDYLTGSELSFDLFYSHGKKAFASFEQSFFCPVVYHHMARGFFAVSYPSFFAFHL